MLWRGLKQFAAVVLALFAISSFCLFAQVTTGTISGTVKDSSGAVIPGAKVTATHLDTRMSRSAVTDAEGHYIMSQLALGEYEVHAEMTGFRTGVDKGIVLTVGKETNVNFSLTVGDVTEQVIVTGEAPLIETATSTLAGLVDEKQVRDLPLNGRSFDQLITLTPGSVSFTSKLRTASSGITTGFSVGGSRWESSKFTVDGVEFIGTGSLNTTPNSASGKVLGVEAIREFAVVTNNGDASYGKKAGGQINIVTQSGTNSYHGAVYSFLRNNHLDARNFFDLHEAPQFKQNNFGATLGGPLRKDRDWVFGNYEGFRSRLGLSNVAIVPDANARHGILPLPDPNNSSQRIPTVVGVAPGVVPLLPFYPEPNGPNLGDGRALAFTSPTEAVNEDFGLVRLDHLFSDTHSLFGRYLVDDSILTSPRVNPHFSQVIPFRVQQAALGLKSTISPSVVNTATFGFARAANITNVITDVAIDPSLIFVPGNAGMGGVVVTGLDDLGGAAQSYSLAGRFLIRNSFSYSDQMNLVRSRHFLQMGAQFERNQANEDQGPTKRGQFNFNGLLEMLQGRATSFQGPPPGVNAVKGWRQNYVAFFLQDAFKPMPSLTFNFGLRYEFVTNPSEVNGRASDYDLVDGQLTNPLRTEPFVSSHIFSENHSLRSWEPRIGFAWDVGGKGLTAVRAGFGVFYDQNESDFRRFTGANLPFYGTLQITNVTFPQSTAALLGAGGLPSTLGVSRNGDVPALLQYNVRVEQSVGHQTRIAAGYVGSHGYHLARAIDPQVANPAFTADGRPFNPNGTVRKNLQLAAGRHTFIIYDGNSFYNSLQFELDRRLAKGLRAKVSYTFSKNVDDASDSLALTSANATGTLPVDHTFDRGLSVYDVTHSLVANWTYELPFATLMGKSNRLLSGWQLSGILNLRSGQPFTVEDGFPRSNNGTTELFDRPDLASNARLNPILGTPQKSRTYFDPAAFVLQPAGFYGNVGRNTLRGPGVATVDLVLQKDVRLAEKLTIRIRAEGFNLFNRANFDFPVGRQLFNPQGQRLGSAGIITGTITPSRQVQFGLKFVF